MNNSIIINGVKVGKKGLRINGKYYQAWYSKNVDTHGKNLITIFARDLGNGLPAELGSIENNSEMMTDYFEKDRIKFYEGSKEYNSLLPLAL